MKTQLSGVVEYADCVSAVGGGLTKPTYEYTEYDAKPSDWLQFWSSKKYRVNPSLLPTLL